MVKERMIKQHNGKVAAVKNIKSLEAAEGLFQAPRYYFGLDPNLCPFVRFGLSRTTFKMPTKEDVDLFLSKAEFSPNFELFLFENLEVTQELLRGLSRARSVREIRFHEGASLSKESVPYFQNFVIKKNVERVSFGRSKTEAMIKALGKCMQTFEGMLVVRETQINHSSSFRDVFNWSKIKVLHLHEVNFSSFHQKAKFFSILRKSRSSIEKLELPSLVDYKRQLNDKTKKTRKRKRVPLLFLKSTNSYLNVPFMSFRLPYKLKQLQVCEENIESESHLKAIADYSARNVYRISAGSSKTLGMSDENTALEALVAFKFR